MDYSKFLVHKLLNNCYDICITSLNHEGLLKHGMVSEVRWICLGGLPCLAGAPCPFCFVGIASWDCIFDSSGLIPSLVILLLLYTPSRILISHFCVFNLTPFSWTLSNTFLRTKRRSAPRDQIGCDPLYGDDSQIAVWLAALHQIPRWN